MAKYKWKIIIDESVKKKILDEFKSEIKSQYTSRGMKVNESSLKKKANDNFREEFRTFRSKLPSPELKKIKGGIEVVFISKFESNKKLRSQLKKISQKFGEHVKLKAVGLFEEERYKQIKEKLKETTGLDWSIKKISESQDEAANLIKRARQEADDKKLLMKEKEKADEKAEELGMRVSELEKEKRELEQKKQELESREADLENKLKSAEGDKKRLEEMIKDLESEKEQLESERKEIAKRLKKEKKLSKEEREKLKKELDEKEKKLKDKEEQEKKFSKRVKELSKEFNDLKQEEEDVKKEKTKIEEEEKKIESEIEKKAEKLLSEFKPKLGEIYLFMDEYPESMLIYYFNIIEKMKANGLVITDETKDRIKNYLPDKLKNSVEKAIFVSDIGPADKIISQKSEAFILKVQGLVKKQLNGEKIVIFLLLDKFLEMCSGDVEIVLKYIKDYRQIINDSSILIFGATESGHNIDELIKRIPTSLVPRENRNDRT